MMSLSELRGRLNRRARILAAAAAALGALCAVGCSDADSVDAASGGSTSGDSTSGGSAICQPGANMRTFGASKTDGATLAITHGDEDDVFWTNSDGSVWGAAHGGIAPHVLAEGVVGGESIAALGGELYVATSVDEIAVVSKALGAPKGAVKASVSAVASGPDAIYFTNTQGVFRLDPGGGAPVMLAALSGASSLAVDASDVYTKVIGGGAARIVRVPVGGGAPVDVTADEPNLLSYSLQEVALDSDAVYWVNPSKGAIMKALKASGATTELASGLADPMSVAVDRSEVFFTVRGKDGGPDDARAVARVDREGGAITYLAHGASVSAYGIVVDGEFAYWTAKVVGAPVTVACR